MLTDPSLHDDFLELHQREIPMLVKSESLSMEDRVMARVFKARKEWKVELTSQTNVAFLYQTHLREQRLAQWVQQKGSEAAWLSDIFSGEHHYELLVNEVRGASLSVSSQQKYKQYELLSLDFSLADEQLIRRSVKYRYQRMCQRQKMLDSYYESMTAVVRTKNPSLLLQFQQKGRRSVFR